MPWTVTDTLTQRHRFVLAHEQGLCSMTELCQRFAISRKTGYKWLHRYRNGGLEALGDCSRAPRHCPHRTPEALEERLLEIRRAHPYWGPRKLVDRFRALYPTLECPAPSTVGDLLKRQGLIEPRRRYRHPGTTPLVAQAPGDVWTADYKGEFRLGSGRYCYPLTVQDAYSRYLLACQGLPSTAYAEARAVFEALFRAQGLPRVIRTDNGAPFAAQALGGLSRLSRWWIQLGIAVDRIAPGCPQQNGRHERMHRTLKAETTCPPQASFPAQQDRFDAFRGTYNELRPHQALEGATPASLYRPSHRGLPERLPAPAYPGHAEVRKVSAGGAITFQGHRLFLSSVLAHERVALEAIDEGLWNVFYYDVLLARLDERTFQLYACSR